MCVKSCGVSAKQWKRMVTKVTFVGPGFTRKPPKYERFIRPMGLRFTKAHVTHPELKCTFNLDIIGVKKNPNGPMYTSMGVITKGTIIEVIWFLDFRLSLSPSLQSVGTFIVVPRCRLSTEQLYLLNIAFSVSKWLWWVWWINSKFLRIPMNTSYFLCQNLSLPTRGFEFMQVNVSELGLVTPAGKVVWGKYAQVTNNPENDGCINGVLLV